MARPARPARLSILSLLGALLALAPLAAAVPPPPDYAEAIRPDYMRRDLRVFTSTLGLDHDQQAILDQLYSDYERDVQTGIFEIQQLIAGKGQATLLMDPESLAERDQAQEELRRLLSDFRRNRGENASPQEIEAMRRTVRERAAELEAKLARLNETSRDPETEQRLYAAMEDAIDAWRTRKESIAREFTRNVQAILSTEQALKWPALERQLTRDRLLPRARFSGEAANLMVIARQANLDDAGLAIVRPLLDEYDLALHAALTARRDAVAEAQQDFQAALDAGDQAAARAAYERRLAAHTAVRDLNDRFAARIVEALPNGQNDVFLREWRERAYARVFRPTRAERLFDAVAESDAVDAPTKQAASQLHMLYLGELEPMNRSLLETIRRFEPVEAVQKLVRRWPDHEDDAIDAELEINKAFNARGVLENDYVARLQALVGNDAFATLPGARAAEASARPRPGGATGYDAILRKFDRDGDGILTGEERARAEEFLSRQREQQRQPGRPMKGGSPSKPR